MLRSDDQGSAIVGSIFGMLFLLVLALGAIETILFVHARNVAMSAVHEGARAAVEMSRDASDARRVAAAHVQRALGKILRDPSIEAALIPGPGGMATATVLVEGRLHLPGPIPATVPIRLTGRASGQREVP